ncbi:PqqD family protein [Nostocoides vanveenii]|uniref:PqqD family protein n=1 Tax=Nostocoides vanveenii TaxID=330835 RepID=UPI0031D0C5F8
MSEDVRVRAMNGPWQISPDVAWADDGEIHVLALRAPHTDLPWRLPSSAAAIWEGLACGMTFGQLLEELGGDATPEVISDMEDFMAELLRRDLIRPAPEFAKAGQNDHPLATRADHRARSRTRPPGVDLCRNPRAFHQGPGGCRARIARDDPRLDGCRRSLRSPTR